jgi:hypothetical protein
MKLIRIDTLTDNRIRKIYALNGECLDEKLGDYTTTPIATNWSDFRKIL